MASVGELTAAYGNFMVNPRHGRGVCEICLNLTDGYSRCYACTHNQHWLDVVAPISYSVAHEQLHHVLAAYKRLHGPVANRMRAELAAVLWRFLAEHEACLCRGAGVAAFPAVCTVPGGTSTRDAEQPLRRLVEELVLPVADRYQRLLQRSNKPVASRAFDARRFCATRRLDGQAVLLVDDTWTTGASAQSAAAALKAAGSGPVAAVVIGRHINRPWGSNDGRLRALGQVYDWSRCVICTSRQPERSPQAGS